MKTKAQIEARIKELEKKLEVHWTKTRKGDALEKGGTFLAVDAVREIKVLKWVLSP
jgi:hypothetical protein